MVDVSRARREFSRFCRYLGGRYKSEKEGEEIILRCVFDTPIHVSAFMTKGCVEVEGERWHPELPKRSRFSVSGRLVSLDLPLGKCTATFDMRSDLTCSEIRARELVVKLLPEMDMIRVNIEE